MRRAILASVIGLGACDGAADSPQTCPTLTVEVEPLDLPRAGGFEFDLAVRRADGVLVSDTRDLASNAYGTGESATYITICDASGTGLTRLDVTTHDLRPGPGASGRLSPGLVPPRTSLAVRCAENEDLAVSLVLPVAQVEHRGKHVGVAFDDVRCRASQACDALGTAVEVACSRPGGAPVALGVRDAHLACAGMTFAVAPSGRTTTGFGVTVTAAGIVRPDATVWSARAAASALEGCTLEADLVAAPDLSSRQAPDCHGWPVMHVALPLAASECEALPDLSLDYAEAGGPPLDLVVASRRQPRPPAAAPRACAAWGTPLAPSAPPEPEPAAPPAEGEPTTVMRESSQGFIDVALGLRLPTVAP